MKKIITLVLSIVTFILPCISASAKEPYTSAGAVVLMVAQTGETVYSENANKKMSMASTTKIMTSLLALEKGNLDENFKVNKNEIQVEGTSMGLLEGDTVNIRSLVYGMLLQSGNDAANSTAKRIGGNVENFVRMMNERAREIGMKNTNFVTPSGLDDENHYSTAYDMALLGCEAVKNPEFRKICSMKKATLSYGNPPYDRTLYNHNRLLSEYDGCFGIKTGFTKKSGRCLVTAAERDGVTLIAVTLSDPNDWFDHKSLFDYGFGIVSKEIIIDSKLYSVKVFGGEKKSVRAVPNRSLIYQNCKKDKVTSKVNLLPYEFAPVETGNVLGNVDYYCGGKLIDSIPLVSDETVKAVKNVEIKKNIFKRAEDYITERIGGFFRKAPR